MQITNISDAKASLSKLVQRAMLGEEIIIGKAGKPVARLVPYDLDPAPRQLGIGNWHGKVWIADDFDKTSDEIVALFEGDDDESAS